MDPCPIRMQLVDSDAEDGTITARPGEFSGRLTIGALEIQSSSKPVWEAVAVLAADLAAALPAEQLDVIGNVRVIEGADAVRYMDELHACDPGPR